MYGVDPATLRIGNDGIVRYVMVATSRTGGRNVLYEGIRCSSGEFKTYARHSAESGWRAVEKPEWQSMFGNMPSRHAVQLARTAVCNNSAPTSSVGEIIRRLKNPRSASKDQIGAVNHFGFTGVTEQSLKL